MIKRYDFAMNCGDDNCLEQSGGGKYCLYKEVEKLESERVELLEAFKRLIVNSHPGWREVYVSREAIDMALAVIAKVEGNIKEKYLLSRNRTCVGNCLLFYRKEGTGYTCDIDDAEEFDRDQAESIVRQTGDKFQMWNKNYIDSVAKRHIDSEYIDYSKAEGSE